MILIFWYFWLYTSSPSISLYIILLILPYSLLHVFNNFLSWIKKYLHLVSSKHLTHPLAFGRIIQNGLILSSSLYPTKFLKPFLPYETLLEITILPIFSSLISIGYLNLWNAFFLISISPKIDFSTYLLYYTIHKNKVIFYVMIFFIFFMMFFIFFQFLFILLIFYICFFQIVSLYPFLLYILSIFIWNLFL